MPDAYLTPDQRHAIERTDALMEAAGLPTYTQLLGLAERLSRPLPSSDTIELDAPLETSEGEALPLKLNLPSDAGAPAAPARIELCSCFDGMCRGGEVISGRTACGHRCKLHLQDGMSAIGGAR